MPRCDCGAYITSGSECQTCRLEHQHGTLEDRRNTCTVCGGTIGRDAPTKTVDGGTAHAECQGQLRCDGGEVTCTICGEPITDEDEEVISRVGEAHEACDKNANLDAGGWEVEQQGLDGEPAQGQTTVDGGVAKDGGDD